MLIKYGILSRNTDVRDVKRILDQYKMKSDTDYSGNVADHALYPFYKSDFFLHPRTFKLILMRSKNTLKYSQYYIFLEECIKYYNDFQMIKLNQKLNNICIDRVLELDNKDKLERFVIVFRNEALLRPYAIIRTQIKHLKATHTRIGKDESDILVNIDCCYANNLYNRIKEELKGHIEFEKKHVYKNDRGDVQYVANCELECDNLTRHVSITRNIGLLNMSEAEFIKRVYGIDNKRFSH